MMFPQLPGWHLIGQFECEVGSWLLHDHGEAYLLEMPIGLTVDAVRDAIAATGCQLSLATTSHAHEDHLDPEVWNALIDAFPQATFLDHVSQTPHSDMPLWLGSERVYFIKAPKHSRSDVVTVFRGVAMTGDIETRQLASVNREVSKRTRIKSMDWLKGFQGRHEYHVHTMVSAHLNSFEQNVNWEEQFSYPCP